MSAPMCSTEIEFQSTHPVRGATALDNATARLQTISIHAPREGCDKITITNTGTQIISIHAPREGCDHILQSHETITDYFNPRTP